MANSKFRVGGGYTAFIYNGQPLVYAQIINERGPQPVNTPTPIQPLDSPYPIEIALPIALQTGMLEITFLEQWNAEVWAQLGGNFATASNGYIYRLLRQRHPNFFDCRHVGQRQSAS